MKRRWVTLSALLGAAGCGGASYVVPTEPQPAFAPALEVAEPPPPARIESLSALPPEEGCLWQDGQWVWRGAGWHWQAGGWVRPPERCYYSLPVMNWVARGTTGALYYRPGRWYSSTEARICPDPARCGSEPASAQLEAAPAGTEVEP